MDQRIRAFRSQSSRRERAVRQMYPLKELLVHPSTFAKDLSLPSIENSTCAYSPELTRAKTPSTNSTSPTSAQPRICIAGDFPAVSARAWAICAGDTGEVLWGSNCRDRREVASLTKIMTCYLCIRLAKKLPSMSLLSTVRVSKLAVMMTGTTADLQEGDELTIWDLLHALMLPSGNDAAYCLAEYFGKHLQRVQESNSPSKNYVRYFIVKMNSFAKKMKMHLSAFDNPHGLADPTNRSTAKDLGKLTAVCMRNARFREVVRTKKYSCSIYHAPDKCRRRVTWLNTNKLLDTRWIGVKTGITPTAGPCLSVCYRLDSNKTIVIVLLSCVSLDRRWVDAVALAEWAADKIAAET